MEASEVGTKRGLSSLEQKMMALLAGIILPACRRVTFSVSAPSVVRLVTLHAVMPWGR